MMFEQDYQKGGLALALRWFGGLSLIVIAPFALLALLIGPPDFDADPDSFRVPWYLIWGGLVVPGIIGIHFLPVSKSWNGILTALYVPACLFSTALFSFWYACKFYGGCL